MRNWKVNDFGKPDAGTDRSDTPPNRTSGLMRGEVVAKARSAEDYARKGKPEMTMIAQLHNFRFKQQASLGNDISKSKKKVAMNFQLENKLLLYETSGSGCANSSNGAAGGYFLSNLFAS